jgi:hypothetical protein
MIAQWENKVMSSLLQFVDNKVCTKGKAFINHAGAFYPIDNKYNGYYTYALPYKQIVADSSIQDSIVMQGVSINGNYIEPGEAALSGNFTGIFHHKGQVLFDGDQGNASITGNFSVKEYNVYLTTKLEEDILFRTKHQVNPRINQSAEGLREEEETYPAIFLRNMGGTNDPLAFGGADNVKTFARAIILSDSAFSLDAVCNILKNTARNYLPIIETLPFNSIGAFTGVIYNYQALSSSSVEKASIWNVTVTKLMPDAKELRGLDLNAFAALVDFEIHGFGKNN